jgi:arylsulfatase
MGGESAPWAAVLFCVEPQSIVSRFKATVARLADASYHITNCTGMTHEEDGVSQPNIILINADQHRWDFIGYEENGVTLTPNLDALGQTGTIFRSAYCTAPLCCPSRAALASGRYGMSSGCFTNLHQLPPGAPSFVSQLRRAGYRTCAVGKTHMEIHAYNSDLTSGAHRAYMDSLGWDEICETAGGMFRTGIRCAYSEFLREQGQFDAALEFFDHWPYFMDSGRRGDRSFKLHVWPLPEEIHETAFVANRAMEWIDGYSAEQPFLLHVGFIAPHSPTFAPQEYVDLYRDLEETEPWGNAAPPDWLADGRRGYRAMITQIDRYVGEIRKRLEARGLWENTILVYTSDHGEMAGDQGAYGKTCFFEGSERIPLLMAGPGIRGGQVNQSLVELIDLGRTLCDLAGVPAHDLDQGKSLVPILANGSVGHRDTVYAEMGCDRMIRDDRHKLMWGDPGADTRQLGRLHLDKPVNVAPSPPRLYDLVEDPHELCDLAHDPGHRQVLTEMLRKLLTRINENTQTQPFLDRGPYLPVRSSGG